jgi:diguanylate cyclase (GGDEF)-like protein
VSITTRGLSRAPLARSAAAVAIRLGRLPSALAFLAATELLRAELGGSSGIAALVFVPVLATALYGPGRRGLYGVLVGVAAFYLLPALLVGGPRYPSVQYLAGALTVAIAALIGLAAQTLVAGVRAQAAESGRRERMLEQVGAVVRDLFASPEPRQDTCRATLAISEATVTMLFEPDRATGEVQSTALAGIEPGHGPVVVPDDAVTTALRSGRARLVTDALARATAGDELWELCGRPASVLFQPLLRGDEPVGVLLVAWSSAVSVTAGHEAVMELLAHEAALVIGRADELTMLTGMAETDPLTGLPNRRAWDARLSLAAMEEGPVTIAMFDLDHFKRFNDSNGHLAGDRLLRDTASNWRDLLRAGDLLARLGGEEFGLLLVGCSPSAATEITERLRLAVSDDQTCSAGLAVRRDGEPLQSVLGRADHALYDAKADGRDHSRTAA